MPRATSMSTWDLDTGSRSSCPARTPTRLVSWGSRTSEEVKGRRETFSVRGSRDRHRYAAAYRGRIQRVARTAVAPDHRPTRRCTNGRTEDYIADEVAVVVEPGHADVAGNQERR